MKTITTIAILLCSIGVNAQINFTESKSRYTPIFLSGIVKTKTVDTVYTTENNLPTRTIQKVYTMTDSTKYTERFKSEYNTKKDFWDFKSVTIVRGTENYSNSTYINFPRGLMTPAY